MAVTLACIAGEEIHKQCQAGRITGRKIGPRETPFGASQDIYLADVGGQSFYLLPRHGQGMCKPAPGNVNYRANMYALKDLGVQCVLAWGPGGAVTHSIAVGDLVILSDVIDRTFVRERTFFEKSPLGFLRQFPVFCPTLRGAVGEVLHEMKLVYHGGGTAAVSEGPRLETPAEVRMLAAMGAELVTHAFAPEVFLARELQLCYAGVCYVVNYAETGSRHRPFAAGDLFGGLTQRSDSDRLEGAVQSMSRIAAKVAESLASRPKICECHNSMLGNVRQYDLPADWRKWFA